MTKYLLLASALLVAAPSACGGDGFEATGAASSTTSAAAGGSGGEGASSVSAGGSGGSGGSAGPCSAPEDCPSGTYCDEQTQQCLSCADLSDFEIAEPEKLGALDQGVARRYPRGTSKPAELLFAVVDASNNASLWVTPDMDADAGQAIMGTQGGPRFNGPLEASVPLFGNKNFFYDTGGKLYFAVRNGASLSNVGELPASINPPAFDQASLAIASAAQRAWWMRVAADGATAAELVTVSLESNLSGLPVAVDIELDGGCHRRGPDASPWALPDGTRLFFDENEHTTMCELDVEDVHDLWMVETDPTTGKPIAPAERLEPSTTGEDERHPSLSADLCWFYFVKGNGASSDLFRAARK